MEKRATLASSRAELGHEEADDDLSPASGPPIRSRRNSPGTGGERGLTKKQLAAEMGFDPSYVSHVEARRHRPTEDFARRAEAVLQAGGAIWQRFQEYDELRARPRRRTGQPRPAGARTQWLPPGHRAGRRAGDRHAALRRRQLPVRDPPRALQRRHRAGHPLPGPDRGRPLPGRPGPLQPAPPRTPAHLRRAATCRPAATTAARASRCTGGSKHDRDAFKEVWLLFENADGPLPALPRASGPTIEYAYTVGEEKWGHWFQRAVRLPTRQLTVRLDFPAALDPQVWGVETSLSAEEGPLRTPVDRHDEGDRAVFDWSTDDPPLNARYRLEWRFRGPGRTTDATPAEPPGAARATGCARLGIVQRGADLLAPARPATSTCPARSRAARDVVDRLPPSAGPARRAAPRSARAWGSPPRSSASAAAAAVVRPPTGPRSRSCCSTRGSSATTRDTDEQYEGCLSFFDDRGLVPRPLRIDVEHARWDGSRMITSFEYGDGPAGRARDRPPRRPALRRPDGARRAAGAGRGVPRDRASPGATVTRTATEGTGARAPGGRGTRPGVGGVKLYRSPKVSYRMCGGGTSSSASVRSVARTIGAEPETKKSCVVHGP